jgi:DNA modification methylase
MTTSRVRGQRIGPVRLLTGDALSTLQQLPPDTFQCCVTSPPYWAMRDYGLDQQIGLEPTLDEYVAKLVEVFREVRRVLAPTGTVWLNLGDHYNSGTRTTQTAKNKANLIPAGRPTPANTKPKDLLGIGWQVAVALREDGWWLRQEIIWHKTLPTPTGATDRFVQAHERIFLLAKRSNYQFDETLRTDHSVWRITTSKQQGPHVAPMPPEIARRCIMAATEPGDQVLDPFAGSGTTGVVAAQLGRRATLIDLNRDYLAFARQRIAAALGQQEGDQEAATNVAARQAAAKQRSGGSESEATKQSAHRARLRQQGMRPVQFWLPDTAAPAFQEDAARQAAMLSQGRSNTWSNASRGDVVLVGEGDDEVMAVIVQNDLVPTRDVVLVCPLTTDLVDAPLLRVPIVPSSQLPIAVPVAACVERLKAVPRADIRGVVGPVAPGELRALQRAVVTLVGAP